MTAGARTVRGIVRSVVGVTIVAGVLLGAEAAAQRPVLAVVAVAVMIVILIRTSPTRAR